MKRFLVRLAGIVVLAAGIHVAAGAQSALQDAAAPKPLPPSFVSASETLFADGMSDPRGGTYRAITVRLADRAKGDKPVATYGWVLPTESKEGEASAQRAVAWNGLTYEVVEDVGPADLKRDVETLIENEKQLRTKYPERLSPLYFREALPEAESVAPQSIFLPKISLLLRVGETRLASDLYAAWRGKPSAEEDSYYQPRMFIELARRWAGAAFNRAVTAHARGDDRLAFDEATQLSEVSPKLESQAEKTGAQQPADSKNQPLPFFEFLRPVPDLLADSRRRLAMKELPVDLSRLKEKHPRQAERIAYLIAHMDDIGERQEDYSGLAGTNAASIFDALTSEGDAAVEPLLNVMDNDKRLTRLIDYPRHVGSWDCKLRTVWQVAGQCLIYILHTDVFGLSETRSTAAVRAYWNANRGLPLAERWYRTLADDTTSSTEWIDAARHIVQPSNGDQQGMWWTSVPDQIPGTPPTPLRGESLRAGHNPTVSALLAKRIARITTDDEQPVAGFPGGHYGDEDGIDGACFLAQWDPKAAQPVLTALMHRMLRTTYPEDMEIFCREVGGEASILTYWRIKTKTPDAVRDYAAFLRGLSPSKYPSDAKEALAPFVYFRNDSAFSAELAAAAESLFNAPGSKWNPVAPPEDGVRETSPDSDDIIRSQLLCLPAFRRQVLRELDDRKSGGALVKKEGRYAIRRGGTERDAGVLHKDEPSTDLAPQIRVCDIYAWKLGNESGALNLLDNLGIPFFDLTWPLVKRDAAIASLKNYLLRFGGCLTPESGEILPGAFTSGGMTLALPPLNHAATPDDVNAGRAIFSLDNPQAQLVRLPHSLPVRAVRLTTTDARQIEQAHLLFDRKIRWEEGKPSPWIGGLVYQAEEVEENGRRQRYYGFVSSHTVERVPAEAIILFGENGETIKEPTR